ncbi:MAG: hypothetical protein LBQ33_06635 [Oscillospiraceae bacterium]|jgi:hypothetical protein|nr:hypothetical protein [Oscillospiraceae bacterium]
MTKAKQEFYNAASSLKRSVIRFSNNVSKELYKPDANFVRDMLLGMMTAQDVKLTKIAAALKEEISLKHTEERLRRKAATFAGQSKIEPLYMAKVLKSCRPDTLLLVDGGDIAKPYGKRFEGLSWLRDGSAGKLEKGLPTVGILALMPDKMPLPVYEKIYSYEKEFVSENHEAFLGLDFAQKYFSNETIRVFDRGYDSTIICGKLLDSSVKFIVRAHGACMVTHKGKAMRVLDVAAHFKGKYALDFTDQKGKTAHCKVWITRIEMEEHPLNLVICHGFGEKPLMLMTNVFDDDNAICIALAKGYLMRWKIEEFYRFKKQTFHFEDMRVMTLEAMNNINFLLNLLIGFLSMQATGGKNQPAIVLLVNHVKRIFDPKNLLYSLCVGIFAAFALV